MGVVDTGGVAESNPAYGSASARPDGDAARPDDGAAGAGNGVPGRSDCAADWAVDSSAARVRRLSANAPTAAPRIVGTT